MAILNEPTKNKRSNYLRQTGLLAVVPGLLIAGPLVGYFIGQWADDYFQSAPWLLVTGIALGFAAAGREIWRLVKRAEAYSEEEDREARASGVSSSYQILRDHPLDIQEDDSTDLKKKESPGHGPDPN